VRSLQCRAAAPRSMKMLPPEFCIPNQGLSPGAAWEHWFKIAGHGHQIPSWEGQKPKASGWVFMTENPPRRCGEGFSSLHPLQGGDFQTPCDSGAKFRYQAARMWEALTERRPTVRLTPNSRRWRQPPTFYRCGERIIPPRNASVTRVWSSAAACLTCCRTAKGSPITNTLHCRKGLFCEESVRNSSSDH